MDEIARDISIVYRGYIVRHIYQVRLGWSMREIITKAMMEVEKCREICSSIIVNQDWIPEIRKWGMSLSDAGVDFRTGYVGMLGCCMAQISILIQGLLRMRWRL